MGYQLVFWQLERQAASALDTYRTLMNDAGTEGLRSLPLTSILTELANESPGWNSEPTAEDRLQRSGRTMTA